MVKQLTKAEEQVMQVLWSLEKAFLKDIVAAMPAPRVHTNTVATILKILIDKEFVAINIFGRSHEYYPLMSKENYSKIGMKQLVKGYFEGSFQNAVSFMVENKNLSVSDLEMILDALKSKK